MGDGALGRWSPSIPRGIMAAASIATKEHHEFGKTLVGETWELDLGQQSWQ